MSMRGSAAIMAGCALAAALYGGGPVVPAWGDRLSEEDEKVAQWISTLESATSTEKQRCSAAENLGYTRKKKDRARAASALVAALQTDKSEEVCGEAAGALGVMFKDADKADNAAVALVGAIRIRTDRLAKEDASEEIVQSLRHVVQAISEIGPAAAAAGAIPAFQQAIASSSALPPGWSSRKWLRIDTATALGRMGDNYAAATVPLLVDALKPDSEGSLVKAAARALANIGSAAFSAIPHLEAALALDDPRVVEISPRNYPRLVGVHKTAALALAYICTSTDEADGAVEALIGVLQNLKNAYCSNGADATIEAARALGYLGQLMGKEARARAIKALDTRSISETVFVNKNEELKYYIRKAKAAIGSPK